MGYVIAALLVLLIVGGFVLFMVTNATRKSNVSDASDPGADQNSASIVGSDDETRQATPAGMRVSRRSRGLRSAARTRPRTAGRALRHAARESPPGRS